MRPRGTSASPRTRLRWTAALASSLLVLLFPALASAEGIDVDGDGVSDTVTLTRPDETAGAWQLVVQASTTGWTDVLPAGDTWFATSPDLISTTDVDGRPGAELFVDIAHISTFDSIGIYTYRGGHVVRAATLWAFGGDHDYKFGLVCRQRSGEHLVVAYAYSWRKPRRWSWSAQNYRWRDGRLERTGKPGRGVLHASRPPRSRTGVAC